MISKRAFNPEETEDLTQPKHAPLHAAHWVWLVTLFWLGVGYIVVLPPFQSNDEAGHWERTMSVSQGDILCDTIVTSAAPLVEVAAGSVNKKRVPIYDRERLRKATQIREDPQDVVPLHTTACHYSPLSYIVPAIATRASLAVNSRLLPSLYWARLASWVTMVLVLILALHMFPWARLSLLAFFSIPEVVQQTAALNNELLIFTLCLALVKTTFGPASARRVLAILLWVALLTLTKIVFIFFAVLAIPHLITLYRNQYPRFRFVLLSLATLAIPILPWKGWYTIVDVHDYLWIPPWGVDPDAQIEFLKSRPSHVLTLAKNQLLNTFKDHHLMGTWRSMFGVLGTTAVVLPGWTYAAILTSLGLGAVGDLAGKTGKPRFWPYQSNKELVLVLALIGLAIFASLSAIAFSMYLFFSGVGSDDILGVQGRYYLPLLLLAMIIGLATMLRLRGQHGSDASPNRLPFKRLAWTLAPMVCSVAALCSAVAEVGRHFWW